MSRHSAGALLGMVVLALSGMASAETIRPKPRPQGPPVMLAAMATPTPAPRPEAAAPEPISIRGSVTNLPLPRFVSLKTNEGNARRGPGLTHRIDWVFTRAGMPLKITAEYENWRRVEDADGLGGWVHYSLLSGTRSVIVQGEMVDFLTAPRPDAMVAFQAEAGVVARVLKCENDWCRVQVEGERGWAPVAKLWGVAPGELID